MSRIKVYGHIHKDTSSDILLTFCEKQYFDQHHCIEDGYSVIYKAIINAFEDAGLEELSDGCCLVPCDINDVKKELDDMEIELILDDKDFISFLTQLP